ncbi:MFS transporter [Streptomyces sp. TG1A-60]|uniref:MFS transporter n=1 Tax=Streptomyces sp. TG1A-60 TaxID=3129111 RepID=UPI0030CA7819
MKLRKGYLSVLILSYCALYVAWIAPTAFSLAIRIEQIAPDIKDTAIAIAVGAPSLIVLVTGPLVGVLSDKTRLRFGRRRTWMLAGMLMGLLGSVLVGLSENIGLLIAAWTLAFIGYTAAGGMFVTHLGDKLPEQQRGKVAGFTGAVTQIAPVVGVAIAGAFSAMPLAMFAAPSAIAFILGLAFIVVMKDDPAPADSSKINFRQLVQGFYFNPRRHPDFAWVWISRFFIFLALSIMSLYTVYLLGDRLALEPGALAGLVATGGLLGIGVAITGSILSGAISDRIRRRKPFIVIAGILLAGGLVVTATLTSITQFYIGSLVAVFGVGIFGAIDQAIGLDTLPSDQGQNGRFLGIFNLANQLAQGVGPFLAAAILSLLGGDYTGVYIVAAAFAVVGGLLVLGVRPGRPTTVSIPVPKI